MKDHFKLDNEFFEWYHSGAIVYEHGANPRRDIMNINIGQFALKLYEPRKEQLPYAADLQ